VVVQEEHNLLHASIATTCEAEIAAAHIIMIHRWTMEDHSALSRGMALVAKRKHKESMHHRDGKIKGHIGRVAS
jgi:hypothetical protein